MASNAKSQNTLVKDAIILFAITLISGILLGLSYGVTKGPIEKANEKATQEAYKLVYPDADKFEEDSAASDKVKDVDSYFNENGIEGATVSEVLAAKESSGKQIGYVISFAATEGYGGDIDLSMGMTNDGEITGLEVLSCSETAGLGAKCQQSDFKDQFAGIKADEIEYTKDGKTKDNQIDAISGATITTKAVTKGVNAAIKFLKNDIMAG